MTPKMTQLMWCTLIINPSTSTIPGQGYLYISNYNEGHNSVYVWANFILNFHLVCVPFLTDHHNMYPPKEAAPLEWSTGLCGCCEDCSNCKHSLVLPQHIKTTFTSSSIDDSMLETPIHVSFPEFPSALYQVVLLASAHASPSARLRRSSTEDPPVSDRIYRLWISGYVMKRALQVLSTYEMSWFCFCGDAGACGGVWGESVCD